MITNVSYGLTKAQTKQPVIICIVLVSINLKRHTVEIRGLTRVKYRQLVTGCEPLPLTVLFLISTHVIILV